MDDRKRKIPKVEDEGSNDSSVLFLKRTRVEHHVTQPEGQTRGTRDDESGEHQAVAEDCQQTVRGIIEGLREEFAQTFNPRFETLEHHIMGINNRLAAIEGSTNAAVTASGEDTTTNRHVAASVSKENPKAPALDYGDIALPAGSFVTTPVLTNLGYEYLLRQFNFRDVAKFGKLAKLDNLANLRDCTLFYDLTFPQYYVDYVIRVGGTSRYISEDIGSLSGMGPDTQDLRIFEIEYLKPSLKYENAYNDWIEKYGAPRYVYEIGQLFLRRRGKRTAKQELVNTDYNVVMDVTKPRKPLWLIARPDGPVRIPHRERDNSSSSPFGRLGLSSVALLSRSIQEFSLSREPFGDASFGNFVAANRYVLESKLEISLEFRKTDISSVEDAIKKTWPVEPR